MSAESAGLLALMGLKELDRAGWRLRGLEDVESVAAHSWGVAMLVLRLCPPEVDRGRAVSMAVLHDLAELHTGDWTPQDRISPEEKRRRSQSAMEVILKGAPDLLALWEEYEARASPEARWVKRCDALDMALQALRYQQSRGLDPEEFLASAGDKLSARERELLESCLRSFGGRPAP